MEKVFFICEINLNVLYYRNENYVFVFYVVVNDIKLYKKLLLFRIYVLFLELELWKKFNFDKLFCFGDYEIVFNMEIKLVLYLLEYFRWE